jgi:two-component sensor histidine kinase
MPHELTEAAPLTAPQTRRLSTTPAVWDARQLRIATDAAGVALWSWDVDTDEIALDERAHRMWGISKGDGFVTFESLSACIHPLDLDLVRASFTATREIFGPYETDFRILNEGAVRWISARGRGDDQGIVGRIMFGVFIDVTERKVAEQGREMIANEMSHRIKNIFATVSALTHIAARSASTPAAMAADLVKRLGALSKAKELVRPSHPHAPETTELAKLLVALLAVYDKNGTVGDRIHVFVPDISVGDESTTTLALVIHELATNSLKYGALSAKDGTLSLNCTVENGDVTIVWSERGGPRVAASRGREGFGSTLIKRSIVYGLDGTIDFQWQPDGLVAVIRVSEARLGR